MGLSPMVNEPIDSAAIARLNDCSDLDALRSKGRLILPLPLGGTVEFDLTQPYRDRHILIEEYWRFHPRYNFFKSVREKARLADLGAGSGGLIGWRAWGTPLRGDIMMYAVDLSKGDFFDQYVDFDLVDLSSDETKFPDAAFDSVILSHLIEHIADRRFLAREVARISRPGAKVYIEWPSVRSGAIVSRAALEPLGIRSSTLNFFDDRTHLALVSEEDALREFRDAGFHFFSSGVVSNDFLYPELLRCGVAESHQEATTYGLWLAFGFSQYLIMERAA